ncbi:LamB/YcsF family protein [Cohnella pontilimi]|uniref:5-oxoprolinase subunit A n=1 Tax=Cohnella pontilimi TaxID=2564100 RepID=A0A4U0F944_9BACL|nr:5-oxoprolinase subunit PxpA [Cohnella pontilimi]TJY40998.1 LamB/YcsF family protein [Cohnella pontilimi]
MIQPPLEIDLNADLGEGYGAYSFGEDDSLLEIVSSANIACGFHAGDPHIMRRTVERCVALGVAVGAHPGLPDRMGFGRREMAVTPEEAADWITYQVGALQAFVHSEGGRLQHVKPHGALYHMAAGDAELASAIVRAVTTVDKRLILFGPPGSRLHREAERQGAPFAAEGFADRAYMPDGRLASRGTPNAMIEASEQAAAQALSIVKEGRVRTVSGEFCELRVRTICVHGDSSKAAGRAKQLASALRSAGIMIRAPQVGDKPCS